MSNNDIALALSQVLVGVPNTPALLSVVGFDAHVMQSFGNMDDIKNVTGCVLASEALMPGHGKLFLLLIPNYSFVMMKHIFFLKNRTFCKCVHFSTS